MPADILRIPLDTGVLVMKGRDSLAMLDVTLALGVGIHLRAELPEPDPGVPVSLFDGDLATGSRADLTLTNGDVLRLRLISVRGTKANVEVIAPDGYQFHGDGIG